MIGLERWRIILVIVVVLAAIYLLIPSIRFAALSDEAKASDPALASKLQRKSINLGLDLRGGMHLVMEIDRSKLPPDYSRNPIDEALEIIRNRVDQFGVSEPVIQKEGADRIVVELPGLADPERAKEIIGKTAILEFKLLDTEEAVKNFIKAVDDTLTKYPEIIDAAEAGEEFIPEEKGTTLAVVESTAAETPKDTLAENEEKKDTTVGKAGELFGEKDTALAGLGEEEVGGYAFSALVEPYKEEILIPRMNYQTVKRLLEHPKVKACIPPGDELHWANEFEEMRGEDVMRLYITKKRAEVTGTYLRSANFGFASPSDPKAAGQPVVNLTFNRKGAAIFSAVTGANVNKRLAIILDGKIHSAPVIQTRIRDGRARITGIRKVEEARDLSIVLRAGNLPAPLTIIEERTIGPALGQDSIKRGIFATILGGILIFFFMIIYYRLSGIIAVIALILNLFLLLAAMAGLHATLTLPGIAGIILTMGMAVDANVLIFERIREELRTGKTVRASIDAGYSRAFRTILDANFTTLISAIILYYFGTGPVKGFAITLSFGIIISMFTAIIVTRMIFAVVTEAGRAKSLSI